MLIEIIFFSLFMFVDYVHVFHYERFGTCVQDYQSCIYNIDIMNTCTNFFETFIFKPQESKFKTHNKITTQPSCSSYMFWNFKT